MFQIIQFLHHSDTNILLLQSGEFNARFIYDKRVYRRMSGKPSDLPSNVDSKLFDGLTLGDFILAAAGSVAEPNDQHASICKTAQSERSGEYHAKKILSAYEPAAPVTYRFQFNAPPVAIDKSKIDDVSTLCRIFTEMLQNARRESIRALGKKADASIVDVLLKTEMQRESTEMRNFYVVEVTNYGSNLPQGLKERLSKYSIEYRKTRNPECLIDDITSSAKEAQEKNKTDVVRHGGLGLKLAVAGSIDLGGYFNIDNVENGVQAKFEIPYDVLHSNSKKEDGTVRRDTKYFRTFLF
jgi:hypothetical protein